MIETLENETLLQSSQQALSFPEEEKGWDLEFPSMEETMKISNPTILDPLKLLEKLNTMLTKGNLPVNEFIIKFRGKWLSWGCQCKPRIDFCT